MISVAINTYNSNEIEFKSTVKKDVVKKTLEYFEEMKKSTLRTCFVDNGDSFHLWIDHGDLQFIRVHSVLSKRNRELMFNSHIICIIRSLIYNSGDTFYYAFNEFRMKYLPSRRQTTRFHEFIGCNHLKDVFHFLYNHKNRWNGNASVFKALLEKVTMYFSIQRNENKQQYDEILNLNSFNRFLEIPGYTYVNNKHKMMNTSNKAYEFLSFQYNSEMNFYSNGLSRKRKRLTDTEISVIERVELYYRSEYVKFTKDKCEKLEDSEKSALGLLMFIDNLHNMNTGAVGKTTMFHFLKEIIKQKELKNLYFVQMNENRNTYVVEDKMFPIKI
jgi:hypothetical protein